jgi:predicted nucleotidyltransferase
MLSQKKTLKSLEQLASSTPAVEVLWLYGSRARGQASSTSDYDLAIAFTQYIDDPVERRLRPEVLALTWAKKLGVELSIIDINQASVPMAYTIVQDNTVIFGENNYRCMVEEQRIMSKWELDYCYHRKHYA